MKERTTPPKTECVSCRKQVDEVCGDGYCRACHVSLSFESCVDGSWSDAIRASRGLLPVPR